MAQQSANLAIAARDLVATHSQAMLSTLRDEDGYPYGSLVDYLPLADGDVVFLLSQLAEHHKYLSHDPRASLLITAALGKQDMLAEPRLTLIGKVSVVADRTQFRDAYLARHHQADTYIDFADFDFFRLQVEKARYIAGFARMAWLDVADYRELITRDKQSI